jgi:hypothetical protein
MKSLILGILFLLSYYSVNSDKIHKAQQYVNFENYCGVYKFKHPSSSQSHNEDQYIVLSKINRILIGLYYGTSDEIDEAREDYFQAYFVVKMENLSIIGDSIKFTLYVSNEDLLSKPISLKLKSTQEAMSKGYKNWGNKIPSAKKEYSGIFIDSTTIFFNLEDSNLNKTFRKI